MTRNPAPLGAGFLDSPFAGIRALLPYYDPSGKIIIVVDGNQAILKPLKGNILDIGGSIQIPPGQKPINFRKVREEVRKKVAKDVARGR